MENPTRNPVSLIGQLEIMLPALPTPVPVEFCYAGDGWAYATARWPMFRWRLRFSLQFGDEQWTEVTLH